MSLQQIRKVVEKAYVVAAVWTFFLKEESKAGFAGFDGKRIRLIAKGFHKKKTIPFDFEKWRFSDYISDFEQQKLQFINHPYNKLLNNKLIFSTYFSRYFRTPRCYCTLDKGRISPVDRNPWIANLESIVELVVTEKKAMLKPLEGADAQGIHMISFDNGNFHVDRKACSRQDLEKFLGSLRQYLLEEFIEQGTFTKALFPEASNTLRIITLIDPASSDPFIPIATLRIGTSISAPIDFFPLGGLIAYIDVESGELSKSMAMGKNNDLIFHDRHPETNAPIKGLFIPNWKELTDKLLETAKFIAPLIKVVGWDVVLTGDGFAVIEGNSGPDTKIQGLDRPLARNPKVLGFLRYHGIRN